MLNVYRQKIGETCTFCANVQKKYGSLVSGSVTDSVLILVAPDSLSLPLCTNINSTQREKPGAEGRACTYMYIVPPQFNAHVFAPQSATKHQALGLQVATECTIAQREMLTGTITSYL